MSGILEAILKDTFTLTQFKTRVRLLKNYLLKTFFGGEIQSLQPSIQDLTWLKSLSPSFYQKFNKDNVYSEFSSLEQESSKLKILTIYITFEADDDSLRQTGIFARKMFGSSMLLDIKLNPNLIGGAALVWKGVYRDYSVLSKIEAKKAEILESFKKFLR